MDWKLILEFTKVLVWPFFIFLLVWIFRKGIENFLDGLNKFKIGNFELIKTEQISNDVKIPSSKSKQNEDDPEKLYFSIADCLKRNDLEQGKQYFKILQEKFKDHKRVGCAVLYMARLYRNTNNIIEAISFYSSAIKDYSDFEYGDGANVGGMARYELIDVLLKDLNRDFSDSINHQQQKILDLLYASKNSFPQKLLL